MARQKEFNRQEALGVAMGVFWERGFEATTMTELRKAMGIGRQSLYDTFGDKDEIFAEALDRYIAFNDSDTANLLSFENPLEGIRDYLERRVQFLSKGTRRGCLIMNSCVELAPHDASVQKRLKATLKKMENALQETIEKAQEMGSVDGSSDSRELALFILSQISGMVVLSKAQATKKELQSVVNRTLKALN